MTVAVESRIELSRARLNSTMAAINGWLAARSEADKLRQYDSALSSIGAVLRGCVHAITATVPAPDVGLTRAYEICLQIDVRTVWTSRLLRFFSERFRGRDDPTVLDCLYAADEMIWSCWRPGFADFPADPRPARPGPVPLPFLDSIHAPEAFPPGLMPADLASAQVDAPFLREHLMELPLPTVRVPAMAVTEPWMLALLAHETGHQLQFAARLGNPFRSAVRAAVTAAGGDDNNVERWLEWSVEIFADLISVVLLGPWALWPIAELELRDPAMMYQPRGSYPPAVVRLQLLATTVTAIGLDPTPAWPVGSLEPAAWPAGPDHPEMKFVPDVVRAGLQVAPPGFDMCTWLGFRPDDFSDGGPVEEWAAWLAGAEPPVFHRSVRAPRRFMAGVVAATAAARRADTPQRDELLDSIGRHAFRTMRELREPGRRAVDDVVASPAPDFDPEAIGRMLIDLSTAELS